MHKHRGGRQVILDAALEMFYEHGYQAASIRDIGGAAGVSQAALYHYFPGKEDLLFTIIDNFSDLILETTTEALAASNDPIECLTNAIRHHVRFMGTHRKQIRVLFEDKRHLTGKSTDVSLTKEKKIFSLYRDALKAVQEAGFMADTDLTSATFSMLGIINWNYHWYVPGGRLTIEELTDQIIRFIFQGILNEDGRTKQLSAPQ
ncbi:MAG: TetR/AcrR family transcriptional regulator [Arenicellales bacterium]|jgi:AcrR family transcriptional regulator|nr:TetR/AcrR family transcriptional regulator [Arenicellales bacterium]MDP7452625.1 TetR/AcrR family transcriptional regulator [Arenicellales bacterium]|tara:strand:+ start:5829 stop:6440 length:612 start_codon:yes stop_codon:yes gene_type:complete